MSFSATGAAIAAALGGLVLALVLLGVSYRRTLPPTGARFRGILFAVRGLAFALLALAILDPVLTMARVREREQAVALLLDTSRSMTLPVDPAAAGPGSASTRWDRALALLRAPDDAGARPLLAAMQRRMPVRLFALDGGARELPVRTLASDSLAPAGGATDLGRAIREARRAGGPGLAAMVIVSDGRNTGGDDAVSAARDALIPVHTVLVGEAGAPPDLAILSARAPETGYAGSRLSVEYELSARGFEGRPVSVLLREDGRAVDSVLVAAPATGTLRGTLAVTPSIPGIHRYTVSVPAVAGEVVGANNDAHLLVSIEKEKLRVLYLESVPRWDHAFLGRALRADEGFAVTTRVTGMRGTSLPPDRELAAIDVLILGNIPLDALDDASAVRLGNFVTRLGRGLLLLGSDGAIRVPRDPSRQALLALRTAAGSGEAGSWRVALTPAGGNHAVTRLARDGATNRVLWESLPPLLALAPGAEVAPGGEILLEAIARELPAQPLLAVSRSGAGKVAAFAGSGIWRWSFLMAGSGRGTEGFDRLASNLVRWLAAREDAGLVRATPDRSLYRYGEPVGFTARVFAEDLTPRGGATVRATLVREAEAAGGEEQPGSGAGDDSVSIVLEELRGNEGVYRGRFGALEPGRYRYRVEAAGEGRAIGEATGRTDVVAASLEFEALETDPALLERIAAESGGRSFRAADAAALPGLLEQDRTRHVETAEVRPARGAWLFLAVVLLLGVEWSVRRRRGLW